MSTSSAVVPVGYKQTEVGVIPEEWDVKTIGELLQFKNGLNKSKEFFGHGTAIINYMDVFSHSGLSVDEIAGKVAVSSQEQSNYSTRRGDVFFTRTSETVDEIGISAVLLDDLPQGVFSGFVLRGRPISDYILPEFSKYCFGTHSVRKQIISTASYTTRALTNGRLLSRANVIIPRSKEEQKRISSSITDIENLTIHYENLIMKKQAIKQGTMQELLTGKTRLPGFIDEWKTIQLGNILTVMSGKDWKHVANETGTYPVLGTGGIMGWADDYLYDQPCVLIGRKGTIDKPQYMEKPFWSVDTLFYCILSKNNFAKFVYYKFLQINWYSFNEASGVPSLNSGTIGKITIKMPRLGEQEAIAEVLSDMDAEIAVLEGRLEKAKAIKQGMMQQLLTGKIRLVEPQTSQEVNA